MKSFLASILSSMNPSPSPHGEGGLKYGHQFYIIKPGWSLPTRGGWIEINHRPRLTGATSASLPTRGGWIEIMAACRSTSSGRRPSPHGEGGLKSLAACLCGITPVSLPPRGGWIEIVVGLQDFTADRLESLPTRGGWIEIAMWMVKGGLLPCPSPHGEGGLKLMRRKNIVSLPGPSPHGEGGLKCPPGC